jgi:ribosomal protein L11 methyltransferase
MVPYKDLYIYEISGEVSGVRSIFREDFIGCWNEEGGSFLFFSLPHDQEVNAFIQKNGMKLVAREVLDYKSWQAGEELKAFKVGNLLICPPWENCTAEGGDILIHLDPCVVFGTGHHPTTRSCLEALWKVYQREIPKVVLDLGTGSGILALAAAKWGAERVMAVDRNELAVDTALRNVFSNKEVGRIEVQLGKAEDLVEEEADLVCANLHRQVIQALLEKPGLFRKRWVILSGVFQREADEVEKALNQKGVQIYERIPGEKWATLVLKNG